MREASCAEPETAIEETERKYAMTSLLLKSAFLPLTKPIFFCSLTVTFLLSKPKAHSSVIFLMIHRGCFSEAALS